MSVRIFLSLLAFGLLNVYLNASNIIDYKSDCINIFSFEFKSISDHDGRAPVVQKANTHGLDPINVSEEEALMYCDITCPANIAVEHTSDQRASSATCVFAITLEDTQAQIAQYQLHVSLIDDESSAIDFLSRLNCSADSTCVYIFSPEFFPVEDLVIFKNMDGSVEIGLPTGVRTFVSLNEANMPNPTVAILAGSDGTSISMRTFTTDTCCYSEVYNPVVITNFGRCTTILTGPHQVLSDVFFHFSWASC